MRGRGMTTEENTAIVIIREMRQHMMPRVNGLLSKLQKGGSLDSFDMLFLDQLIQQLKHAAPIVRCDKSYLAVHCELLSRINTLTDLAIANDLNC